MNIFIRHIRWDAAVSSVKICSIYASMYEYKCVLILYTYIPPYRIQYSPIKKNMYM